MLIKLIGLELKKLGKVKTAIVMMVLTIPLLYIHLYAEGGRSVYENSVKPMQEFYNEIKGELTQEKYNLLKDKLDEIINQNGDQETAPDGAAGQQASFLQDAIENCEELIQMENNRQIIIENAKNNLKNKEKLQTYYVRYNQKVLEKAKELSQPMLMNKNNHYSFLFDQNNYIFYIIPAIIIILCGCFTKENESGMEMLLKSAKDGRKKSFIAKHIVMIMVCTMVTIYFQLANFLGEIYMWGIGDITYPLRCVRGYEYTLYDYTIIEYFLLITFIRIVVVIVLGNLIMLVSILSRRTIASAGLSAFAAGVVVGIPYYMRSWAENNFYANYTIAGLLEILKERLCTYAIFTSDYFKEYTQVNILEYPIDGWKVITFWGILSSLIIVIISRIIYCGTIRRKGH